MLHGEYFDGLFFFFSSRRRHTRFDCDWSSDVCSSDLWDKELSTGGWLCLGWPRGYGGRAASVDEQLIFQIEYARANPPYRATVQGQDLLGPTILAFGSPEQKSRFLPRIVAVEELWGQGFSEPGAGSDLAGLRTSARLDGDEWV